MIFALACKDSKPAASEPVDKASVTQAPDPGSSASDDAARAQALRFARSVFDKVRANACRPLWDMSGEGLRAAIGSVEALEAICSGISKTLDPSARLVEEEIRSTGDGTHYRAHIATATGQVLEVSLAWDRQRTLTGMLFRPLAPTGPAPSRYDDYLTKTPLRLPFTSAWTVFWGGRSAADNYHVSYANQHFAYDLVITRDGKTHSGQGKKNMDYFCFGREVVAAGAGEVVDVVRGVKDNTPGEMNPSAPTGNHVILKHGNDEYSLYAHLKENSLAVQEGDRVGQGEAIGLCGNSGNSSEPHLHFHLQDSPTFGEGESMPAQFLKYWADGVFVERGEPTRGQVISPTPPQPTGAQ